MSPASANNDTITIRALQPDEWEALRDIRLRALQSEPGVFSSNYEREAAYGEAEWRDWLSQDGKCMFGLFDEQTLVGITGIFTWRDDPSGKTAILGATYIDPAYRGRRLSHLLYGARIDWAKAQPGMERIIVSHRQSNDASRRANQAFGFKPTHTQPKTWPDGVREDEMNYELKL